MADGENLLDETIADILKSGHETSDVAKVGSADGRYAISWNDFEPIARNTRYVDSNDDEDDGYVDIASDLTVFFRDGSCLVRAGGQGEEDKSYWDFKSRGDGGPDPKSFDTVGTFEPFYVGETIDDIVADQWGRV